MNDWLFYGILVVTGLVAGVINVIAGGGSNLTIPALMLMGMPADVANATNRIGVLFQSVVGSAQMSRQKSSSYDDIKVIVGITLFFGGTGALSASLFSPEILKYVLLGSMLLMAIIMLFKPAVMVHENVDCHKRISLEPNSWWLIAAAGFYGGLIQAGVGLILLAAFSGALNYDIYRANVLKLLCTVLFSVVAVAIFIAQGLIMWQPAIVLAIASGIGAFLGAHLSFNISPKVIQWLILSMTVMISLFVIFK